MQESSSSSFQFDYGKVSTVEIVVPNENDFGATNLAFCATGGDGEVPEGTKVTEESKVMASHADLALGADGKFAGLLESKMNDDDNQSMMLLNEIVAGYREATKKTPSDGESSAEAIDTDESANK
jgi:hypothetical protein